MQYLTFIIKFLMSPYQIFPHEVFLRFSCKTFYMVKDILRHSSNIYRMNVVSKKLENENKFKIEIKRLKATKLKESNIVKCQK